MGFFESAEAQKQQQMAHDPDYGKTNGQIASEHSSEIFVYAIIIIVLLTVFITYLIRTIKRFRADDKFKATNKLLEKRKSWRITKVTYWIIVTLITTSLLLVNGSYNTYPLVGWGILLGLICYPLFILFRKLYMYVNNIN